MIIKKLKCVSIKYVFKRKEMNNFASFQGLYALDGGGSHISGKLSRFIKVFDTNTKTGD